MVLVFGKTWYSFFNKYDARFRVRTLSKSGSAKVRYLTTCDFPVRWHLILSSPCSDSQFGGIWFSVRRFLILSSTESDFALGRRFFCKNSVGNSVHRMTAERQLGGMAPVSSKMRGAAERWKRNF